MRYRTQGMTMHTPAGPVDLVPLYRYLDGAKKVSVHANEREAAVLALAHLGVETYRIGDVVTISHTAVRAVLRAYDVKGGEAPRREPGEKAQRREKRRAQRELEGDRLIHPEAPHGTDCGYIEYFCRCELCSAAHAAKLRADRDKRRMVAAG